MTSKEQDVSSVWTRPQRKRRDNESLNRDQIVAEAVRLLDAEGMDALSMRRLGARLNAGATSLYWHVANKDELIELVVDEIFGELDIPEIDDPARWREAMTRCAISVRDALLRHPWFSSTFGEVGLSYLGPNMMRLSDRMLAILERGGFDLPTANRAVTVIIAYVTGVTSSEASWHTTIKRSGRTEQEWLANVRPAVAARLQAYPRLAEAYELFQIGDPAAAREDDFRWGLDRVLDGLSTSKGGRRDVRMDPLRASDAK
ncbi:TetR/AcrR family transcriptional regulator [Fodinicola acaciae]|uniref:TetR/AcrR family transcriptional regulator n=1 Tax=Fodinicola acaciae TaxID=2681555 RepID=UPI0013D596A5|nr:TetR/AcrR family transcriptional regulator [Fodinicola acaciae]